jgi:uncharacterized protein YbjT (DUF2867 family)
VDSGKARQLALDGVEFAPGDLKDPDSLRRACRACEAVISTASSTLSRQEGDSIETVDRVGQLALIDAAMSQGVSKFVFVSTPSRMRFVSPLVNAKREVEARLAGSGLVFTILNPNAFMEISLGAPFGFDLSNGRARIYGTGANPVSYISYKDVARFSAGVLDAPSAANRVLEICGPAAVTQLQAVRMIESAVGRAFTLETVPQAALEEQWRTASDPMSKSIAGLMLDYAAGLPGDPAEALSVVPLRLTSVAEYAAAAANA